MTDSYIGIDEPTTIDKKADTEQLVVGANTVERERVQVAGAAAAAIAAVVNSAPTTEYGIVVRQAGALPAGTNNIGDVDVLTLPVGTVAGSASLPAGTNNIGDVDIASALPAGTNNIGDVDVLSVVPGTGATNLGKAIDAVAGAADTGVAPVAVRDDALSALTPIEGDYVPLRTDANGALWTHDDALDAALAGTELQVDVVAALPAGTNAIGKLAANTGVDIGDVDILSIAAGDNNIGNVDV